jgi:hypothetical protein
LAAVLRAAEPGEGWTQSFRAARREKEPAQRRAALEKLAANGVGEAIRNSPQLRARIASRASEKPGAVPLVARRAGKEVRLQVRPGPLGVVLDERVVPE